MPERTLAPSGANRLSVPRQALRPSVPYRKSGNGKQTRGDPGAAGPLDAGGARVAVSPKFHKIARKFTEPALGRLLLSKVG